MASPLGKAIPRGEGRRLVIGDIHGCLVSFQALIDQISPAPSDQLFLLGDYVNKGPRSKDVLEYILDLDKKFQVFPLLGNHDQMVLRYLQGDKSLENQLREADNHDFFDLEPHLTETFIDLFSGMYQYFILDSFLLVHAGFDFSMENPFLATESMLNIRQFYYDSVKAHGKTIVHGHFPQPLSLIREKLEKKSKIIPLDNGCVYKDREGQGNLLCLELNSGKLYVQPRLD